MSGPAEVFRLDGTELAGYRVRALIGRGGMAYVYRAEDSRLGRTVALKVLAPELADNEDFRRRFLRESRLAASLDHPNIIPIYDAGEVDGKLYIVMRYVEGSDLKAVLQREPQLGRRRVVDIFSQVAAALDDAHANELVHRDVKPANILMATATVPQGHDHVYLSDFGITKRSATSQSGVTATGAIMGTIDYLAPEQIAAGPVDARTDEYALGCVVYQALTGTVPFVRDNDAALMWAHLTEAVPDIRLLRPDLPHAVNDAVSKAMAKSPGDRYATCGEFVAALADGLYSEAGRTPANQAPVPPVPDSPPPTSGESGHFHNTDVPGGAGRPPSGGHAAPPRKSTRGKSRWRTGLAALVAVVLVAVVVAGYRLLFGTPATTQFERNDVVPFSFAYPADWQKVAPGNDVLLAPRATDLVPLFLPGNSTGGWSATGEMASEYPGDVVGMFTFSTFTDAASSPVDEQKAALTGKLPPEVSFTGADSHASLGRAVVTRLTGEVTDPANKAVALHFECYIAPVPQTTPRTAFVIFFAWKKSFDSHRDTFDRIAASVDLRQ